MHDPKRPSRPSPRDIDWHDADAVVVYVRAINLYATWLEEELDVFSERHYKQESPHE